MKPPNIGISPADVVVEIEAEAWSAALPDAGDLARRGARAALGDHEGAVAVLLTDDDTVRDLNIRFRDSDSATNVLAFPATPNPQGAPLDAALGDVALAFGVCEREARAQGKTLADHLRHLVIHGVLHLLGYDHLDDDQATAMETRERELLARLGVPDPYAGDEGSDGAPADPHSVAKPAVRHG